MSIRFFKIIKLHICDIFSIFYLPKKSIVSTERKSYLQGHFVRKVTAMRTQCETKQQTDGMIAKVDLDSILIASMPANKKNSLLELTKGIVLFILLSAGCIGIFCLLFIWR